MAAGLGGAAANPRFAGLIALALAIPIVPLWMNCVGEAMSQSFYRLIDSPSDPSGATPKELAADLDRLADLSNRGQTNEALQLCAELLKKEQASRLAMETVCFRLYSQMFADESLRSSPALSSILHLCESGQFIEAESQLVQMLEREPENLLAAYAAATVRAEICDSPKRRVRSFSHWKSGQIHHRCSLPTQTIKSKSGFAHSPRSKTTKELNRCSPAD